MKPNRLIALFTAIAAAGNAGMTTITAAESAATAGTLYGDANLDGKITVADAVAVLQFIANQTKYALEEQGRINADVIDAGEGITGLDAIAIQMIDAQLIRPEDLPMTADELKKGTGKKDDKQIETPKPTAEQLELMKTNPLIVLDGETNKPFIYGDMNGDMKLDDTDAAELGKLVKDGADYNRKADLNRDEAVDQNDADILDSYLKGEIASFPVYAYYDSDKDGLNDFTETVFFGTDRLLADTDGDGLTDADEIYSTNTNPLVADSAGNGTSDAEADPDGDGLSNIKEIELGTDPNSKDTDGDGFDDKYEITTTKTSPVKKDTDGDGLTDSEEKELGLDPLSDATDGTPDSERIITQVIPADDPVFSEVNTNDNAYELSVEIKASGYAKKNLSVIDSPCAYVLQDGSAVGFTPEFIYNDDYKVESITLNFEIKEPFRDNVGRYFDGMSGEEYEIDQELDGIKRLNVFRYFDSINLPMPVYTEYDLENNIVRVTIDSFETNENGESYGIGSYSLVDLEVWGRLMSRSSDEEDDTATDTADIDTQGFIRPAENVQIAADSSATVTKTMPELLDDVRELIEKNYRTFADKNRRTRKVPVNNTKTLVYQWNGHRYAFYEYAEGEEGDPVRDCEEKGGHLMVLDSKLEMDFILSGEPKGKKRVTYHMARPIKNGTPVFVDTYISDKNEFIWGYSYTMDQPEALINLEGYDEPVLLGGYYCENGYPGYDTYGTHFGYLCEWEPDDEILDNNVYLTYDDSLPLSGSKYHFSADSGTDSDGDGIPDWDEIDHEAIIKLGGSAADSAALWKRFFEYITGAVNGEKSKELISKINKVYDGNSEVTPLTGNIYSKDTDGDGIEDSMDKDPNHPFDTRNFKVIEDFDNYPLWSLVSEGIRKDYSKGINEWNTESWADVKAVIPKIVGKKVELIGSTDKSALLLSLLFNNNLKSGFGKSPLATLAMDRYLDNSGEELYVPLECGISLIGSQRIHYYNNMNSFFELAESTVKPDEIYSFATTTMNTKDWIVKYNYDDYAAADVVALDWYVTIHGASNAMKAKVHSYVDDNGNTKYWAYIKYYLIDVYDWAKDKNFTDVTLKALNNCGKAKVYMVYGEYTTTIEWSEGSRYPNDDVTRERLKLTEFDGINDYGALHDAVIRSVDLYEKIS